MPKRFYKHKLLLDELMYSRQSYPKLNHTFDVKHIRDDLRLGGTKDPHVYELPSAQERILITANGRHFRHHVTSRRAGVINFPASWSTAQIDTKLTALLMRHGQSYFTGHYRTLATEEAA
jgi:hypothetical protein